MRSFYNQCEVLFPYPSFQAAAAHDCGLLWLLRWDFTEKHGCDILKPTLEGLHSTHDTSRRLHASPAMNLGSIATTPNDRLRLRSRLRLFADCSDSDEV